MSWSFLARDEMPPVEVTLGTGEIIDMPYPIYLMRVGVLDQREKDRLAYCEQHDIDPTRFVGCHGCEGTGYNRANGLSCWCGYGTATQERLDRQEQQHTEYLRRNWAEIMRREQERANSNGER